MSDCFHGATPLRLWYCASTATDHNSLAQRIMEEITLGRRTGTTTSTNFTLNRNTAHTRNPSPAASWIGVNPKKLNNVGSAPASSNMATERER